MAENKNSWSCSTCKNKFKNPAEFVVHRNEQHTGELRRVEKRHKEEQREAAEKEAAIRAAAGPARKATAAKRHANEQTRKKWLAEYHRADNVKRAANLKKDIAEKKGESSSAESSSTGST